jgi:excinuclease ABC subunit A
VVVIEHNLDVIKVSDRLIDLGPEGGDEGGQLIATGTPEQVAAESQSHTGQFLADVLARDAKRARSAAARPRAGSNGTRSAPARPKAGSKGVRSAPARPKAGSNGATSTAAATPGSNGAAAPPKRSTSPAAGSKPRRRATAAAR